MNCGAVVGLTATTGGGAAKPACLWLLARPGADTATLATPAMVAATTVRSELVISQGQKLTLFAARTAARQPAALARASRVATNRTAAACATCRRWP